MGDCKLKDLWKLNGYEISNYHEYLENKVFRASFFSRAANSLGDDDVRISDRL